MVHSRRNWTIVGIAVAFVVLIVVSMQLLLNADTYRGRIEAALTKALGRNVQLGHLHASLLTASLVATAPSIAEDPAFGSQPFLTAKDIKIGVEVSPLVFHRELHITRLTIDQPDIRLLRAQNGTWNYSSLGATKPRVPSADPDPLLPNLTVQRLNVKNGTVTVQKLAGQRRLYTDVNVGAQDFSFAKSFPFTVKGKLPGGGALDVRGTAGPMNQKDASLTALTAQLSLKHADLVAAGLVEPQQGISGLADLDAKVQSTDGIVTVDGKLHLMQLKLARRGVASSQPVDCDFSVNENLQTLAGQITRGDVHIGAAQVGVSGIFNTRGNSTTINMKATGQSVPIDPLVAFLPSLGVQLPAGARLQGGTLTSSLQASGPTSALVITGPVRIVNTQLAGFDLGQKLSAVQALMGAKTGTTTSIQELATELRYGPDGTHTDNLMAVVVGVGSVSGSGFISSADALNYHLLVKPSSTGAGAIAGQAISLLSGALGSAVAQGTKNGIPVVIGGTTSNPTFAPDVNRMIGGGAQRKPEPENNPLNKALGGLFGRR